MTLLRPYYQSPDGMITLYHADCIEVFPYLSGLSSICSDLPAGISMMGRKFWDGDKGGRQHWIAYWAERIAAAKAACIPDHVSFFWSLPRTQHWSGCAVEDAGYRIIDTLTTINGQGWPKSKGVLRPCKEEWIIARSGRGLMDVEACRVERGGEPRSGHRGSSSMMLGAAGAKPYEIGDMAECMRTDGSLPCNIALGHCGGDGGLQCRPVGVRKVKGEKPRELHENGHGYGSKGRAFTGHTHGGNVDGSESLPAYECRVACRSCGSEWLALSGGDAPRCECGAWGEWGCRYWAK